MIGGGGSNDLMRPLHAAGEFIEGVRGTHRGVSEDLNVANPQPGTLYYWARADQADVRRFGRHGFRVVREDDPERKHVSNPDMLALDSAGMSTSKDVILMKISEEDYARYAAHEEHKRKLAIEGPTRDYVGKNSAYEAYRPGAEGDILYAARGHKALDIL